jgi:hypothetical protein
MKKMIIKRISTACWIIENEKGTMLQENITLSTTYEAEEYIKNYVSSYLNVGYEVKDAPANG